MSVTSSNRTGGSASIRVQVRRTERTTSAAPLDLRTPSGRRLPY